MPTSLFALGRCPTPAQLEVLHEDDHFHWATNRELGRLVGLGELREKEGDIGAGRTVHLVWPSSHRYPRRQAESIRRIVQEYSQPDLTAAVGLQSELLVLEAFVGRGFLLAGKNTRRGLLGEWTLTDHNLDFVFEKDGVSYGVEVKNTLGYMDQDELDTKMEMCRTIGLRPVFAARMLPRPWIIDVHEAGGYSMILKYQLYPLNEQDLVRRIRYSLGLPVDTPAHRLTAPWTNSCAITAETCELRRRFTSGAAKSQVRGCGYRTIMNT